MSLFETEFELESPFSHEWESPMHELHEASHLEMELAHELAEIHTEQELEEFLGKLIKSVGRVASGFVRSPIGKMLGGVLKGVAKTALPMIGTMVAPGIGTALGGLASRLLEVQEQEMMTEQEAELEAARRYVQWARGTTRYAMRVPPTADPRRAIRSAAVLSARQYAPALLRAQGARGFAVQPTFGSSISTSTAGPASSFGGGGGSQPGFDDAAGWWSDDDDGFGGTGGRSRPGTNGRWARRGNRIVLFNV